MEALQKQEKMLEPTRKHIISEEKTCVFGRGIRNCFFLFLRKSFGETKKKLLFFSFSIILTLHIPAKYMSELMRVALANPFVVHSTFQLMTTVINIHTSSRG